MSGRRRSTKFSDYLTRRDSAALLRLACPEGKNKIKKATRVCPDWGTRQQEPDFMIITCVRTEALKSEHKITLIIVLYLLVNQQVRMPAQTEFVKK